MNETNALLKANGLTSNRRFQPNARTDVYEERFKAGIIDPTKVTRLALENAASIAALLLTTEAAVAD
ncbi:hypothetical protein BGP76_16055 [Reichenbachiella sp. MSK19-1]|nr:hypothetical protein BGP76_16055 [Reichenbachiella sp. MSK19-1]